MLKGLLIIHVQGLLPNKVKNNNDWILAADVENVVQVINTSYIA